MTPKRLGTKLTQLKGYGPNWDIM